MFQKLKPHLKWIVPIVVVILLILFFVSQSPKVISATVSPEVIVNGQNQEITVTAVVKPRGFVPLTIRAVLVKQGKEFNSFDEITKTLGFLSRQGKDSNGNVIYQKKFTVNYPVAETLQVRLKNFVFFDVFPRQKTDTTTVWPITLPTLRLAVTPRPFTLPPDPGEAGKTTLEGIDSDNDRLRDDIQREIFFAFPESERVRKAMGEIWRYQGLIDINYSSHELIDQFEAKLGDATICADGLLDRGKVYPYQGSLMEKILHNTDIRLHVSTKARELIRPYDLSIPNEGVKLCDFDWQSLPD